MRLFSPAFVFNNIPALNVQKRVLFSFPLRARPQTLFTHSEFRLDTHLHGLDKQGMKHMFGREEGLRCQPHLAG
jgi:hypothetical protein